MNSVKKNVKVGFWVNFFLNIPEPTYVFDEHGNLLC